MPEPERSQAPDPDGPGRGQDRVIALFVAVTWAAVVFAVDGLLAVVLDRDPIGGSVTPYYGLLALLLAGVLVWFVLAGTARSHGPWFGALAAAAGVYLLLVGSAAPIGLVLAAQQAGSPFVLAAALLAAITVIATWVVIHRTRREADH